MTTHAALTEWDYWAGAVKRAGATFVAMNTLRMMMMCLLALGGHSALAQATATAPDLVVVRVHESYNEVSLVITRAQGESEAVAFPSRGMGKNTGADAKGYHKVFAKLYQEGYVLQSTFTAPWSTADGNAGATTLLFVKGK